MRFERSSGIILHVTSLPGAYGIGSLGKGARDFIDFLAESEQKLWQMCPLGPTGYGDSPYQTFSAFAGNPLLIDLDLLIEDGYITRQDLESSEVLPDDKVDYGKVIEFKHQIFRKAFEDFRLRLSDDFNDFCNKESFWLDDFAFFMSIKDYFGGVAWNNWDHDIKVRNPEAIEHYREKLKDEVVYHEFLQYIFYKQWNRVREYAKSRGVKIIGDIPIFVAFDSADAWSHPELFFFDEERNPTKVAGVPPDYFSATGQLWGNPLYNWGVLKQEGYDWWIQRFRFTLDLVDIIRVDHFRGFAGYWAVPAGEKTAVNGNWEAGPGQELFEVIQNKLGELPIIAEDLGIITDDVHALRDTFEFPGMKILHFAFEGGNENPYLPHNYPENCLVYTGTHDNDTTLGWYRNLPEGQRNFLHQYFDFNGEDVCWKLIEAAWFSKANMAIAPMQDFLELDSWARLNKPGVAGGNWQWRVSSEQLSRELAGRIRDLTRKSGR